MMLAIGSSGESPGTALVPIKPEGFGPRITPLIKMVRPQDLTFPDRRARKRTRKVLEKLKTSIRTFGFLSVVLVDDNGAIIIGCGRVDAALELGLERIPVLVADHLSALDKRAVSILFNRLAELSEWDEDVLSLELQELNAANLDFKIELIGFEGHALEMRLDPAPAKTDSKLDRVPEVNGPVVTRPGDLWITGSNRVICGDSRLPATFLRLMEQECADAVIADAPYNVKIDGNVGGKGRVARRAFSEGCGEMSPAQYTEFLAKVLGCVVQVSRDGSIHFVFIDWRHLKELLTAGEITYTEMKNLIVWAKTNAGMGTFYRSQHELIGVYKHGAAPHTNTFGLGETGRWRSNVWTYPGANSFGRARDDALDDHPTPKSVAMIIDAIKDVTHRGEIVLDPFGGSGTTLIAAEKIGRRARLVEIDPYYCDVICRRWAKLTGRQVILEGTGQTFDEVATERAREDGGHV